MMWKESSTVTLIVEHEKRTEVMNEVRQVVVYELDNIFRKFLHIWPYYELSGMTLVLHIASKLK